MEITHSRIEKQKLVDIKNYYKTNTTVEILNNQGEVVREYNREVLLYHRVDHMNVIKEKLVLSFGDASVYEFDKRFMESLNQMITKGDSQFVIDHGMGVHVKTSEMKRIMEGVSEAIKEHGIVLVDDYFEEYRKKVQNK